MLTPKSVTTNKNDQSRIQDIRIPEHSDDLSAHNIHESFRIEGGLAYFERNKPKNANQSKTKSNPRDEGHHESMTFSEFAPMSQE
ncbi:hypothetical protein QCH21_002938 [Enterobacter bugandensis]|uniref:hypothetical protein n=1 Tax=Enterobacter TaxID=547 RepID=UPI00044B60A2|nr:MULTISPECIES: hypothetical protein [Enterobacter]EKS6887493.1 hypothetical protein [Enterobacter bugandensis]EKS6930133.1 hypothetical protein [Enterobacter bugandensis]EKS7120992.1 hypothetical protein [Enterobacter bugandensis]EKV5172256.1 hypothetical protein [Enterobacter bugandensis]EMC1014854.1 hypothetical protein [Enterobacter bugandensis]